MKVKVKMTESIGGLADVDKKKLDEKYSRLRAELEGRDKPPSEQVIKNVIKDAKVADRYDHVSIGFSKDWAFKPGDEPMIEHDLAKKWEASGICVIVGEEKKAA